MGLPSVSILVSFLIFSTQMSQAQTWGTVSLPSKGIANSIGFYSNGCISGASTLPIDGVGYQVMRPSRNRFYGQPATLEHIQNLGKTLAAVDSGVLIGDISQPRGGPMVSGHASHQIGLDVDIWFWNHPEQNQRSLTLEERETLPFVNMLNANGVVDPNKFTAAQINKLRLSAVSPGVERIFVNPAIKAYLCAITPASESAWLHALRPWPGHNEHFHVRFSCPKDSKDCVPQQAQAPGDGCDEVYPKKGGKKESADSDIEEPKKLPEACTAVLKE